MAETKQTKMVLKKKKWYPVIAPKVFREEKIGEINLIDPAAAIGRKVKISLMQITGEPKTQNTRVEFIITGQHEGKLTTEIIGYELNNTAMKRMIRRGRTKLQDSIVLETADSKKIRIKPVVTTRNNITSATKKELRKRMLNYVKEQTAKNKFENIIKDLTQKKFQRAGIDILKKLCPIHSFDMSKAGLAKSK